MTIDEAIAKFEKEAQDREWKFKRGKFIDDASRQKCNIKANEYRQLAEWLRELKDLREESKVLMQECDRLIKEKGELLKRRAKNG